MSRISVEPIRNAVLVYIDKGGDYKYICQGLEWKRQETSRLKRMLGIKKMSNGNYAQRISYENACLILRAIGEDPVDYGV